MKKISFVIPVYNEEANLPIMYGKLKEICDQLSSVYDAEIVFVNDGSKDKSWNIIKQLSSEDSRIQGLLFTRNFGHQIALTAGYDHATGDAVISLDADLQDPPELIKEMLQKWEAGYHIIYARRSSRSDGFLKDLTAFFYYKLLHLVAQVPIPQHVGDFRLIDKSVLTVINQCREQARYLRGMVAWTGFSHTFIDFKRPERIFGQPAYTWSKSIQLAFDGLANFSLFPLRIAAFVGFFVIVTGSLMFFYIALDAFLQGTRYPLFKWLVTIIYIFMGVQFLLMWLLGEYIGRMYDQQKNRPLYIVQENIGF